jgi:hypothetical protein
MNVDLKNTPSLLDRIGKDVAGAGMRACFSTALRLVGVIVNELIPAEHPAPVDTRAYAAAWEASRVPDGAVVSNSMPYAGVIEGGARAENIKIGRKMISALTEWVRRKGIVSKKRDVPVGNRKLKSKAEYGSDVTSAAWAIATAMKKRGIFNRNGSKGLGIAEKATKRAPDIFKEELARELEGKA